MIRQKKIAKYLSGNFLRPLRLFEDFSNREEVSQRLRHLFLIDLYEAIMYPVACEFFPRGTARLCDFILVMGENEVHPPTMNIEGLTQMAHGHSRTFDVPSGTPGPPGAFPGRLARLAALPKSKIHRMSLSFILLHTCSSLRVVRPPV